MAYSIVDAMIYARPEEWAFRTNPDHELFEKLSDQVDDRLYVELVKIYMRPGDQTEAMIEWAKSKGIPHE